MVRKCVCCLQVELEKRLKRVENYEQHPERKLSEVDTQVLFVEPVLKAAGWDISDPYQVKRADRSKKIQFDVECYSTDEKKNTQLYLAIEVKAYSSQEFNIDDICDNNKEVGKLVPCNGVLKNKEGDGVGQLRWYCLNYPDFGQAKPILTNGQRWAVFKKNFLKKEKAGEKVSCSDVQVYDAAEQDQLKRLVEAIKRPR